MASHVVITSPTDRATLRPLIEAAVRTQLRVIETGLRRTESRLHEFEDRYNMSSQEFYQRLTQDQIQETLDTIEWAGEYKTWLLLQGQYKALQGARIAD